MNDTITEAEAPSTGEILQAMLTENTGRHMLDSGGAYGRHWEKNRGKNFADQPHFEADWRWGGIEVTANVYHELVDRLEYLPEADAFFERWGKTGDRSNEGWFALTDRFIEEYLPFATGIYGDGKPMTVNTYNEESMLSQVLQYTFFVLDEEVMLDADGEVVLDEGSYVFLQIHGGCDVRGGYTQPRIFEVGVYDDAEWFDIGRTASVGCSDCHAVWFIQDAYGTEPDGRDAAQPLEDYPTLDISEPENFGRWAARNIVRDVLDQAGEHDLYAGFPVEFRTYFRYATGVSDTNISHCPECGVGTLEV